MSGLEQLKPFFGPKREIPFSHDFLGNQNKIEGTIYPIFVATNTNTNT